MTSDPPVGFGEFRLEASNARLWRGTQALTLAPKVFAVLQHLVAHAGQLVTKDELWRAVWPDVTVTDAALTVCLSELRHVLEDDAKAPRFIETVHRRGYRFIAPLTPASSGVSAQFHAPSAGTQDSPLRTQASILVGRATELSHLHHWLETALNGKRQLVFVTGEPGIGKTALVETFLRHLDAVNTPWLGRGQCIEHYGAGEPYLPVLQALGELGRGADRAHFLTVLRHYAPSWLVQLPALLEVAERETLQRQTAGVTRERMLRELVDALEACTAAQGVVLWLEDLHWSDPSTVELLALLARRQAPARLLVVGTYRPVEVIVGDHPLKAAKQELQMHAQCQELPLPLLSEPAVEEYLAAKVPAEGRAITPLQPLARLIHQRTDGNPLFMVTVVEQVLTQRATSPALKENGHVQIPATLRQLIEQQVGCLDSQDQRLLDAASVVGTEFSAAAVAAALADDLLTVEGRCEQLARRGTVLQGRGTTEWPDGTVAGRYGFLHALYQDVLATRLPAAQRVRLHQQIGTREEQAYGERAREIANELAVHFEQGRDYQKAVRYLQLAGENAVRRHAHREAITHFTKGIELLETLPDTFEHTQQEFALQIALGGPRIALQGFAAPEVGHAYSRALELCRQGGETPQLFEALYGLCGFHIVRAEYRTARELAEQCLSLAQSVHDPALLLRAHHTLGVALFWLGELARARVHQEQALALYHAQPHNSYFASWLNPGVVCLNYVSSILRNLGYVDQALKQSQEALALARELAHPFSIAMALCSVAGTHLARGEGQSAQERAEELITLSTAEGFAQLLADGTRFRGSALVQQGHVEEGIAQIEQGISTGRSTGFKMGLIGDLAGLALAYVKAGHVEKGLTLVAEALALVDKTGERVNEAALHVLKGWFLLARSRENHTEAEACFHRALAIARGQSAKPFELHAVMGLARLWSKQGKQDEARKLLGESYGWFTEGFDTKDLQEAKALLDKLS